MADIELPVSVKALDLTKIDCEISVLMEDMTASPVDDLTVIHKHQLELVAELIEWAHSCREENKRFRERLQIDPGGGDAIDAAESALEFVKHERDHHKATSEIRIRALESLCEAYAACNGEDHPAYIEARRALTTPTRVSDMRDAEGQALTDYVMRYGGRCRDCADEDGTCPSDGTPCDPDLCRAVVKKTLKALHYGFSHGFIQNPFIVHTPVPDAEGLALAWRDVLAERRRQTEAEGWTTDHDDQHTDGALAKAATCYASVYPLAGSYWPWDISWWKPSQDRRRNLVKAGALILAEIERLDRAALRSPSTSQTSEA